MSLTEPAAHLRLDVSSAETTLSTEEAEKLLHGICEPEYSGARGGRREDKVVSTLKAQLFASELADEVTSEVKPYIVNGSSEEIRILFEKLGAWTSHQRSDDKR